jgi:hypothetical protein
MSDVPELIDNKKYIKQLFRKDIETLNYFEEKVNKHGIVFVRFMFYVLHELTFLIIEDCSIDTFIENCEGVIEGTDHIEVLGGITKQDYIYILKILEQFGFIQYEGTNITRGAFYCFMRSDLGLTM